MRLNQLLGRQRQSRERLTAAARRWAELTVAGDNPLHEQECGEIVNVGGHRCLVTVYVKLESIGQAGVTDA